MPGSACCDFRPDMGIIDVNLENNIVSIAEGVGGLAADLQNFWLSADTPDARGEDTVFYESSVAFLDAIDSGEVTLLSRADTPH